MQDTISTSLLTLLCRATPAQREEIERIAERIIAGAGGENGMLARGEVTGGGSEFARTGAVSRVGPPGFLGTDEVAKMLSGIREEIAAVRDDRRNLLAGRARLEQMHGEGMFAFARHIDREAREIFLAIMAAGDVAKAARELGMKDSTLRSKLEKWSRRGKAYATLAEIVRWRKSIKGQAGMDFAKRVASGAERDVDFPALIRDVIGELEEMDPENWEDRCGNLAEALRKVVS